MKKKRRGKKPVDDMLTHLTKRKYWQPTYKAFIKKVKLIESKKEISEKEASIVVLDYIGEILKNSEPGVMKIIRARKKDIKQTRVSVAGNNFQALVAYALHQNILLGNLPPLHAILKPKQTPIADQYTSIKVAGETQKPDMDILIYSDKPKTPIVISSCKTSLRERAGQTYKWKLLLDLATTDPEHLKKSPECPINKYKIEYNNERKIYVILITADFYNEINQPQQRGMISFFDETFVTKPKEKLEVHVKPLSEIISYLKGIYPVGGKL